MPQGEIDLVNIEKDKSIWLYDMKEIFGKKLKNQPNPLDFKAEVRSKVEKWWKKEEKDTSMPMNLITRDLLPPWMSLYKHKVVLNPKTNSIPKKTLIKLSRQKWKEEKIIAFNQYCIKSKNQFNLLESNLDDVFEEIWIIDHPSDVLNNEDSRSNDGNDEDEGQAQREIQKVVQEEIIEKVQETSTKVIKKPTKKQGKV